MTSKLSSPRIMVLISALLIVAGVVLGIWAVLQVPSLVHASEAIPQQEAASPGDAAGQVIARRESTTNGEPSVLEFSRSAGAGAPEAVATPAPAASVLPVGLTVAVPVEMPRSLLTTLGEVVLPDQKSVAITREATDAPVRFDFDSANGQPIYNVTFAAAGPFDTIFPETTWEAVKSAWAGDTTTFTVLSVLSNTVPALEQVLGPAGATVQGRDTITDILDSEWKTDGALALVPFDQLTPRFAVYTIDGETPVENANKFHPEKYPFVATVYAHEQDAGRQEKKAVEALLATLPVGNRDPSRLTTLTMTGVTAMVRMMANEMEKRGTAWPAEYVGPELSTADITHISNEVPFVEGCEPDLREDNFNFCSPPNYLETLRLSGVDIIGLTGNHQNDFGQKAAYASLDFYEKENLPVYGGGRDVKAANEALYITHNGNRLAFLGANSYGPEMAWADVDYPGSAKFDLNILSAKIRAIKQKHLADVVLVELQYQESYGTEPLIDQRNDFNALVEAGADIVTGVQSHVPQAMEFTDGKLILYGLGNLYFDQMYQQNTRENLIVKHTFYNGKHISTQVMTTLLYDFGQPRWMTPDEREALLSRVFNASYW